MTTHFGEVQDRIDALTEIYMPYMSKDLPPRLLDNAPPEAVEALKERLELSRKRKEEEMKLFPNEVF